MAPREQLSHCSLEAQIEDVDLVDKIRSGDSMIVHSLDTVLAHAGSLVGQGQHAVYAIRVTRDGEDTLVKRRFSEFGALHGQLLQSCPAGLPFNLPDKGLVRQFNDAALQERKCGLNVYLKALCQCEDVNKHPAVLHFLGVCSSSVLEPPAKENLKRSDPVTYTTGPQTSAIDKGTFESKGCSTASDAPYQAEITRFDVVGDNAVSGQGSLFPGFGALVKSAGSLAGHGQHALYTVRITCNGNVSTVQKRFSDFDKLHTRLSAAFPAGLSFVLPDKTTVSSLDAEFLRGRARALNTYLKALCNSGRPAQYSGALTFFELDAMPPAADYLHDDDNLWV